MFHKRSTKAVQLRYNCSRIPLKCFDSGPQPGSLFAIDALSLKTQQTVPNETTLRICVQATAVKATGASWIHKALGSQENGIEQSATTRQCCCANPSLIMQQSPKCSEALDV